MASLCGHGVVPTPVLRKACDRVHARGEGSYMGYFLTLLIGQRFLGMPPCCFNRALWCFNGVHSGPCYCLFTGGFSFCICGYYVVKSVSQRV